MRYKNTILSYEYEYSERSLILEKLDTWRPQKL